MQLLDRIVFGPHHEDPSLHELVGKAYTNAFTTSNIPKGFEGSGLYPVNGEDELWSAHPNERINDGKYEARELEAMIVDFFDLK